MKSPFAFLVLVAAIAVFPSARAQPAFTPEQYKEIARLLAAERDRIRAQVRKEIEAEAASKGSVAGAEAGSGPPATPGVPVKPLDGDLGIATVDQIFSTRGSGIELSASAGDSDATIVLERSESDTRNGRFVDRGWALKFSSPIDDEDAGSASFGTLSGFADGLAVELSYTHASTRQVDLGGTTPSAEWMELCRLSEQELDGCTLAAIDSAAALDDARELRTAYRAFQRRQYGWGRLLGFKVGAARNQYEFLDAGFEEQSDTKVGWKVGAAMGFSTPRRNALFSIGFDLERAYEEADEETFCPLPAPTPCVSGRLGAPQNDWNRLLWVEARSAVWRVPFSFRVTREFEDRETGIDMPIYLLHDPDGAFTGGIRFGWTSEDGADAGVFVGTGFDVFN